VQAVGFAQDNSLLGARGDEEKDGKKQKLVGNTGRKMTVTGDERDLCEIGLYTMKSRCTLRVGFEIAMLGSSSQSGALTPGRD